jgi:hypothetical protein
MNALSCAASGDRPPPGVGYEKKEPAMSLSQRARRYSFITAAAVLFAACASQMEPAQKLIGDIEAAVSSASVDAEKYVPDQLHDVQSKLSDLKASFDKKDYAAVVTSAPAVLTAAQGLAAAAAAKKDEAMKALNTDWTGLATALPGYVSAIQSRIDLLGKKSSQKMAAGIDVPAAKAGLADATALWSKAQAAFSAGNLEEAVNTAKDVKTKIDAVAAGLKLTLSPPAAPAAA